jgi:undecaprenyl-diphosphatase
MNRDKKLSIFFYTAGWAVALTLAVWLVDRGAIGPGGSKVGLATVNGWFRSLFDYNESGFSQPLYFASMILAVVSLAVCLFWVIFGLVQRIVSKSRRLDHSLFAAYLLYAAAAGVILLFRLIAINYSPVIMPFRLGLDPSYPSAYIIIVMTAMFSSAYLIGFFIEKHRRLALCLRVLCGVIAAAAIVLRTLCGVSWLTDIVAGILFSSSLLLLYSAIFCDV